MKMNIITDEGRTLLKKVSSGKVTAGQRNISTMVVTSRSILQHAHFLKEPLPEYPYLKGILIIRAIH